MSTTETMQAAAELLADLGAEFLHPGFIYVRGMAFGDADGDAYRFNLEGGEPLPDNAVPADKWELPLGANRERIPASYVAAAPGTVQASHAGADFHKNPMYGGENTRSYHSDETEQAKVRSIALPGALDEDAVVTDAKSAADGPAQVVLAVFNDAEGNLRVSLQTAGGNGREQGINLAPIEDQERLSEAWKARGAQFGLGDMPEGWRGYRFLGVYDLRDEARSREYLQLVDKLNPNQGVVQDTAARADIDAALNIPVDRLVDIPLMLSPEKAREVMVGLVRDAEKLGLDRNLVAGLVKNPGQSQFYIQRLLIAAAFRSKAIGDFFTSAQWSSGHATIAGLIKSATATALKLRVKGQGNIADALGRTLERVAEYAKAGKKLNLAIRQAADQQEIGEDGPLIQQLAGAIAQKVAFHPLNKRGIVPVDAEETMAGFDDLMQDIASGVDVFTGEADLLGEARTIGQTIEAAIAAHFRKSGGQLSARGGSFNRPRRIRELQRKRQAEGLTRWESEELTALERNSGQEFLELFDAALDDRFALESEVERRGLSAAPVDQLQLLARRGWDSPSRQAAEKILQKSDDLGSGGSYDGSDEGTRSETPGPESPGSSAPTAETQGSRPETGGERLAGDGSADAGPRGTQRDLTRDLDERGRDRRLVKAFGDDWPHGWQATGFPEQPTGIENPAHPLLLPTIEKSAAELRPESLAVRLLGLQPGTVSRKSLREAIVGYFLAGGHDKAPLAEAVTPQKEEVPEVLFMGGGGASGKTSMLGKLIERGDFDSRGKVWVNPDETREFLPEYDALNAMGDSRSSMLTHDEASLIADEIERRARQRQLSIIKDGTMKNADNGVKQMEHLRAEGYRVRMLGVTIDPHEALVRGYLRAKGSKRYVPDAILLGAHRGFNRALIRYIQFLGPENIAIYDNTPRFPIRVSPEDVLSRKFEAVWERQNVNPEAETLAELLSYEGQVLARGRNPAPNQLDLFAEAQPEIDAYESALESEGITVPTAKAAAAMQDLSVSAPEALDLFGNPLTARPAKRNSNPKEKSNERRGSKSTARGTDAGGAQGTPGERSLGDLFELVSGQRQAEFDSRVAEDTGGSSDVPGQQSGATSAPDGPRGGGDGSSEGPVSNAGGGRAGGNSAQSGGKRRRPQSPAVVERPPVGDPARNHRISPGEDLSPRGIISKLRANIEAIEAVKAIDAESRNATTEEKSRLAKFSGWGAISQVFDDSKADAIANGEIETRRRTAADMRTRAQSNAYSAEYFRGEADRQEEEAQRLENWRDQWGQYHQQIRGLLTEDEYRAAKRSTINAHYTSPEIISGMWAAVQRLGFKGGTVLEPGAGIGHFFGLMPESIADRSRLHGVELDTFTARILRALYPEADIQNTGFQTSDIADNSIDLAISNVPFANVPVVDKALEAMGGPVENLHDYFFGKALTKLKPGGLQVFITSAFTMDKGNSATVEFPRGVCKRESGGLAYFI